MGRRRKGVGRRRPPLWFQLPMIPLILYGVLNWAGNAWELARTDPNECPTVVDTNPGRGFTFECTDAGGQSKNSAVAFLTVVSLAFAGIALYFALRSAAQLRSSTRGTDAKSDALLDDLSDLHGLHKEGHLTDDELQKAIDNRLRRD